MFLVRLTLVFMLLAFVVFFMLTMKWNAIGRAELLIGGTEVTPVTCSRDAEPVCLGFVI